MNVPGKEGFAVGCTRRRKLLDQLLVPHSNGDRPD